MLKHRFSVSVFVLFLLALCSGAWAQQVTTDQPDYAPGSTAVFYGMGFHPNETVTLAVIATDVSFDLGDGYQSFTTTTDGYGNFQASWYVPLTALDHAFLLTADCQHPGPDPAHLHAETTFTDSNNKATTTALASSQNPSHQGSPVTFTATVTAGSTVVTNGSVTFTIDGTVSGPQSLSNAGQATFTAPSLAGGTHSVVANYTPNGNGFDGSTSQTLTQTVTANSVPNAQSQTSPVGTSQNTPVTITLAATDADGTKTTPDTLTYTVVSAPNHGTLNPTSGTAVHLAGTVNYSASVAYTPSKDYAGSDSFTFKVNDGTADSNTATVNITVNDVTAPTTLATVSPAPDAVTGWNNAAHMNPDGSVTVTLTATDNAGGSGVKNIIYSITGALTVPQTAAAGASATITVPASAQGPTTIAYQATDNANNAETSKTIVVNLDTGLPGLAFGALTPPANAAGWNSSTVTVPFTVTESVSGLPTGSPTGPLTFSAEGQNQTLPVTITDNAGNSTTRPSPAVSIDLTKPVVAEGAATGTLGSNGWYRSDVTVGYTASDALSGLANTADASFALSTSGEGMNVPTAGKTVTDKAGNAVVVTPHTFNVDKTVPAVTLAGPDDNTFLNNAFTLRATASDTLSGVDHTIFQIDNSPAVAGTDAGNGSWSLDVDPSALSEAVHTWTATAYDKAGNLTTATARTFTFDHTPPTTTAALQGTAGTNGWYRSAVTVTLSAADGLSGVAATYYSLDAGKTSQPYTQPFTLTGDQDTQVTFWSVDKAGNEEAHRVQEVKIDATPPGLTFLLAAPAANGNGWNTTAPVRICYTVSDNLSGVAGEDVASPLTFTAEGGNQTQSVTVTDNAGNTATFKTAAVNIDTVAPSVAPGDVTDTTWRNTDLSQVFTATDATSGLASDADAGFTLTASAESAGKSTPTVVTHTVTDKAGNSTPRTVSALIDKTKPVIAQGETTGTLGDNGWYRSDVTVSYTASDALSGLLNPQDASFALTTSGEGANVPTAAKSVADLAGNASDVTPLTFNVDKTPPTIKGAPNRPPDHNGWYNKPVTWTFQADDAVSGFASVTDPIAYGALDANGQPLTDSKGNPLYPDSLTATVTASAKDKAGNPATQTFPFQYDATPPVVSVDGVKEGAYVKTAGVTVTASDPGFPQAQPQVFAYLARSLTKSLFYSTTDPTQDTNFVRVATQTSLIADGNYTLIVWAVDDAGNASTPQTLHFTVDQTAPVITFDPSAPLNNHSYNTDQTLLYSLTDNLDPDPQWVSQKLDSELALSDQLGLDITSGSVVRDEGKHTVTLNAVDQAGNTATNGISFLLDKTIPTLAAKLDGSAAKNAGWYAGPVTVTLSAADPAIRAGVAGLADVAGSGVASLAYGPAGSDPATWAAPAPFVVDAEGIWAYQFSAADKAGNVAAPQTVTVRYDKTPPAITVPSDITVEATGPDGASVPFAYSVTDNVSATGNPDAPLTFTADHASGDTFPIGKTTNITTQVTVSAADAAGNTSTKAFAVTVQDTTPPAFTPPANITAEATSKSGAAVTFDLPTATDAVDLTDPVTADHASGSTFPIDTTSNTTTTVKFTSTDKHGNTTTKCFTVTVQDTTPPVIAAHDNITKEATSKDGAVVCFTPPTATDAVDGSDAVTCTPASGSVFPLGTTIVHCTATDAHGNPATETTFTVTVQDTTAPVISNVPANITGVEATSKDGAVVTFPSPVATDLVDGNDAVVCTPASGSTFPLGTTTVTVTSKDQAGNPATATFTVTVVDTTPPAITVPTPQAVEATGSNGATVSFSASATDIVDGAVAATCSPASGSVFPIGTTTVTVTATDKAGNPATKTFTVTVQDTTPPVITPPANITAEATGPGGATVTFAASATDIVDGAVAATCSPASGSTFPLGATTVTVTATDSHGNKATATFTVTVQDKTAPTLKVPANIAVTATSAAGATVTFAASATDIVDGPDPVIYSQNPGTFPLGTTTVTVTATDKAGNTVSASFTVTVTYSTSVPFFLQPINSDGTSIFKLGSTVPVKFQLTGASAGITNAVATLKYGKGTGGVAGDVNEAVSTAAATTGNLFRYDPTSGQYIFNWSTKGLAAGTYQLLVDLGDGVARIVNLGLR